MTGVEFLGWTVVCVALFALFLCLWLFFTRADDLAWIGYVVTTCVYVVVATWGFRLAFGSLQDGASATAATLLLIVPTVIGWHVRN